MLICSACGKVPRMNKSEFTTKEAAAELDESERLVRLWCQQGRFPHARRVEHPRGDYWLIPKHDVESFTKPKPGPVPKASSNGTQPANGSNAALKGAVKAKKRGKK